MPLISLVRSIEAAYPDASDFFSPSERYPEYPFDLISRAPNPVYAAVRQALLEAGLDAAAAGTTSWNPLGAYVRPGATVFVLCNFVYHRRSGESERDFQAKCTDGSVLRALLDYVLIAAGRAGRVRFGNAPLQSTNWSRVLRDARADVVQSFYQARQQPVEARDLRLLVTERAGTGGIRSVERRDEHGNAVAVDLGAASLLEELGGNPRFRVGDYDPRRTESFHEPGRHVYVINRLVLESDVVLSVPKLKTHEKVGMTTGLKGFVGAIGHKDCLAHHRRGAPGRGGDEYPRGTPVHRGMTALHEWLQKRDPSQRRWDLLRIMDRIARTAMVRSGGTVGGAWYGNDTAWRMSLDIGRVLRHATADGRLHDDAMRRHLLFVDGIIGGEGNGPLAPDPVESGMLLFADDVAVGDYVCACYMGFDPNRLELVRRAFGLDRYDITPLDRPDGEYRMEGARYQLAAARTLAPRPFVPPPGWVGHVEATA
jgi:hypothetical protein